jgi:hypothetical protein
VSSRTAFAARAVVVTAVLVTVAPTTASAFPTVTTDRSCYAETEPLQFTGSGFTPGGDVGFFFAANGRFGIASTKADGTGAFQYTLGAPKLKDFDADSPAFDLTVTANDQTKLGPDGPIGPPEETFAASQVRISEWSLDVPKWNTAAARSKRGQRFKVTTTGWTSTGDTLYVHYVRGGKAVFSEKVGGLKAPCGDLSKTVRAFNFKTAKFGKYAVRFSTSAIYSGKDAWLGYRAVQLVR